MCETYPIVFVVKTLVIKLAPKGQPLFIYYSSFLHLFFLFIFGSLSSNEAALFDIICQCAFKAAPKGQTKHTH